MTEPAGIEGAEPSILPVNVVERVRDYLEVGDVDAAHDFVRRSLRRAYIIGWLASRRESKEKRPAAPSPWDRSGRLPAS